MIYPEKLRINDGSVVEGTVVHGKSMKLSWALGGEGEQSAYLVRVLCRGETVFESGWVEESRQSCEIGAPALRSGDAYEIVLCLRDGEGCESRAEKEIRILGGIVFGSFALCDLSDAVARAKVVEKLLVGGVAVKLESAKEGGKLCAVGRACEKLAVANVVWIRALEREDGLGKAAFATAVFNRGARV